MYSYFQSHHYHVEDVKERKNKILAKVKKIVSAESRLGNHYGESEEVSSR